MNNPVRYFQDTCKTYATRPNFSDEYPARLDVESKIKSPKVSIIIPIYNGEKYIKDTLESALAQDENEIEIVCINDGSCDGTEQIINNFIEQDKRITLISQINKGQSAARNTGMKYAKGKYLIFLDADDMLAEMQYHFYMNIVREKI